MSVRITLIIGLLNPFGLSRQVIPSSYEALPNWLQPVTGSIINITLVGAVRTSLGLLIGRQRTQTITMSTASNPGAEAPQPVQ